MNNKIDLKIDGNTLILREGKALEEFHPEVLNITGVLDSPLRYLEKRIDTIDMKKAHILVDRNKMSITLRVDEKEHFGDTIIGELSLSPDFIRFGINTGEYRTTLEMAEFIKMNRAFFENRSEAMDLVHQLRKFKAKVEKDVESEYNPNKGDKRVLIQQAVESNVPSSFNVLLPLFTGYKARPICVETYFNPEDMTCTLVSAEANEGIVDCRDEEISRVLESIQKVAPDIVILEI